jgi:hypothetical protein
MLATHLKHKNTTPRTYREEKKASFSYLPKESQIGYRTNCLVSLKKVASEASLDTKVNGRFLLLNRRNKTAS